MTRVAVYGKGGIGKSTFSANFSSALAMRGRKVLQVGCDPKHDSTRFLLHGNQPTTVLDYLRSTLPADYRLSDILVPGYLGIGCVEAGGPQPGVGCAGRGIISTFELLEQFHLNEAYDTTVYDVLGDVVCGGFAVPIRREYADTILIVTSGEFMALYAANNILKGIRNYDLDQARIAGLICNCRNVEDEAERVDRFAQAVGLPVFATIPRSESFARAEALKMTVMEHGEDEALISLFEQAAAKLDEGCDLYAAHPLSDEELEEIYAPGVYLRDGDPSTLALRASAQDDMSGARRTAASARGDAAYRVCHPERSAERGVEGSPIDESSAGESPARYLSKAMMRREPLHGCAFNGAVGVATQVTDAVVLAHAPTSCAFISAQSLTAAGRRTLFDRGVLLPASIAPNLECTSMGQSEIVFGGMDRLVESVERIKRRRPAAIIVVSACPAGIIGDDISRATELSEPGLPVIAIKTDGNMSGDYQQGMFLAYQQIGRGLIRPDAQKRPRTVAIVGEKALVDNTESNFERVRGYLERLGLTVVGRFGGNVTVSELQELASVELVLPAYLDYASSMPIKLLAGEFGLEIFEHAFPVGFDATCDWLRELGERFDAREAAEELIAENAARLEREQRRLSRHLSGKRLMVVTYMHELDWVLKTALGVGMDIVKVGVIDYSQDEGFRTRIEDDLAVEQHYDVARRDADIATLAPDVLLANYSSGEADVAVSDVIPMCPDAGFDSGLTLARRWAGLLQMSRKGGWRDDAELYRRYNA